MWSADVDMNICTTDINKYTSEAILLQKNSRFWCDQIYRYERYDFGHTWLCFLGLT